MELITEGNVIYSVQQIGGATVKTVYGYVVEPPPAPEPVDRVAILEQQIQVLTTTLGDLILDGGL